MRIGFFELLTIAVVILAFVNPKKLTEYYQCIVETAQVITGVKKTVQEEVVEPIKEEVAPIVEPVKEVIKPVQEIRDGLKSISDEFKEV